MLRFLGRYIPKGAIKVADKKSDAVAYLYDVQGKPGVRVFYGKQSKPVVAYYYTPRGAVTADQQRVAAIKDAFTRRQQWMARKAEHVAAAKAGKVAVGTYFYTSWGYDQTNIDWYRVDKLIGATMALVTKVAAMDASNGDEAWMTGKSIPSDQPVGDAFKVRLSGDGFRVGRNRAWVWDGTPKNWTAYA